MRLVILELLVVFYATLSTAFVKSRYPRALISNGTNVEADADYSQLVVE